ncbi:MAG: ATP-binding cassette domain-containing protein [Myxococcota bacterium]
MTASLRCEALSLTFPSGFRVGPLSLDLGPGLHHLVAPNGTGKTTLLRCLCGGWRDTAGALSVCGADPRTERSARAAVAFVPADPELPPWLTVDEAWHELAALRGAPGWDGAALRTALDLPGELPLGHCSAGQRRRAELLAAAAGDPPVLLLDEPFANLDPDATARVAACLERWRSDRVVVVTSHGPLPLVADTTIHLA